MKKPESLPSLTRFKMGVPSAYDTVLGGAGDEGTFPPELLPQHLALLLKGYAQTVACKS